MGIAKLYGQKASGTNINGIIKDYHAYAGENISAGDLVEFINGVAKQTSYGINVDTPLVESSWAGESVSAIELDNNRVLIFHSLTSSGNLYAMVVTISGSTITKGTDTKISSTSGSGRYLTKCIKLSDGRIFIACRYNNYIEALICTISGTTITLNVEKALVSSSVADLLSMGVELLENDKIFLAYADASKYYLYANVYSISGTTISGGSYVNLSDIVYTGQSLALQHLDDGRVFIAHGYRGADFHMLYGMICSINGTTITRSSDTELSSVSGTGNYLSLLLLEDNKVFIAHSYDTNLVLYGAICTINGTSMSLGTETSLGGSTYSAYAPISTILLPSGRILIFHNGSSSDYKLTKTVVKVEGTTVTKLTGAVACSTLTAVSTGRSNSSFLLKNNVIFSAHSYSSDLHLYANLWVEDVANNTITNNISITEYETQVRKTTTSQFDGIAKTNGTGGTNTAHKDLVSVYTL